MPVLVQFCLVCARLCVSHHLVNGPSSLTPNYTRQQNASKLALVKSLPNGQFTPKRKVAFIYCRRMSFSVCVCVGPGLCMPYTLPFWKDNESNEFLLPCHCDSQAGKQTKRKKLLLSHRKDFSLAHIEIGKHIGVRVCQCVTVRRGERIDFSHRVLRVSLELLRKHSGRSVSYRAPRQRSSNRASRFYDNSLSARKASLRLRAFTRACVRVCSRALWVWEIESECAV